MTLFNNTPNESTLNKAAYCVLYEVIKTGVGNIFELRKSLEECIKQCDTLSKEEKNELLPVYKKAYEISCNNTFYQIKQLVKQVGSDFTKDL